MLFLNERPFNATISLMVKAKHSRLPSQAFTGMAHARFKTGSPPVCCCRSPPPPPAAPRPPRRDTQQVDGSSSSSNHSSCACAAFRIKTAPRSPHRWGVKNRAAGQRGGKRRGGGRGGQTRSFSRGMARWGGHAISSCSRGACFQDLS